MKNLEWDEKTQLNKQTNNSLRKVWLSLNNHINSSQLYFHTHSNLHPSYQHKHYLRSCSFKRSFVDDSYCLKLLISYESYEKFIEYVVGRKYEKLLSDPSKYITKNLTTWNTMSCFNYPLNVDFYFQIHSSKMRIFIFRQRDAPTSKGYARKEEKIITISFYSILNLNTRRLVCTII